MKTTRMSALALLAVFAGCGAPKQDPADIQAIAKEARPMGMNAPGAEQNFQFVLNLMHWLSGALR